MVKNHYIGFISNGKGTLSRGKKKDHNKNGKIKNEKYHWLKKKKKKKRKTYKVVDQPFIKL